MRIGLLIISSEWGGAEETVYFLAKHLKKIGCGVALLANDELASRYSSIDGLEIFPLGSVDSKIKLLKIAKYFQIRQKLSRIIKEQKLELVHAHLEGSLFVCFDPLKKINVPLVFTLHGTEIRNYYSKDSHLIFYLLRNMLVNAVKIISPSKWQIDRLEKRFKDKTLIIPNGVDINLFRLNNTKKEKDVILFVGRYVELKGIKKILAVAKLTPQYKYWFVGWGELSKLMNLPNVTDLGMKSRDALVDLYNQATICVFPSHHEAFGIAGLESLSCGTPIIASKKGFSEFLEDEKEGLILEENNIEQLENSVISLMRDPKKRRSMQYNALRKVINYNWTEIIKKYYDLYEEILA